MGKNAAQDNLRCLQMYVCPALVDLIVMGHPSKQSNKKGLQRCGLDLYMGP